MNNFKILFFAFTVLFLASCGDEEPRDTNIPRTFADVEADFQDIDMSPGVQDVELQMFNGVVYSFRVIIPEKAINENRPLILTLHGASTSPDAHKNTACYAEPGLDTLEAIILSPNSPGGLWFDDYSQEMVGNLMFLATKYWPVETDKIAVTGYSNGGNGSWLFGKFQSSTLSAAIPMASSYDVHELDGSVGVWNLPLYVIHGENDELFPLSITQGWVEETVAAGSDITFVVADGLGHYTPCEYTPYLKEAAIWLQETVWK